MDEKQAEKMVNELRWLSWGLVKVPLMLSIVIGIGWLVRESNKESAADSYYDADGEADGDSAVMPDPDGEGMVYKDPDEQAAYELQVEATGFIRKDNNLTQASKGKTTVAAIWNMEQALAKHQSIIKTYPETDIARNVSETIDSLKELIEQFKQNR